MARRQKTRRRRRSTRVRKQRGGSPEFFLNSGLPPLNSTGLSVSLGGHTLREQTLPLMDVQGEPKQTLTLEPNTLQSLVWFDPDAPAKSWLHSWEANRTQATQGTIVVPWAPPMPPSGIHRYICVLFSQATQITPEAPKRANFRVEAIMEKQDLTAVAGTGMRVAAA